MNKKIIILFFILLFAGNAFSQTTAADSVQTSPSIIQQVEKWYEEMRENFSTDKKLKLYVGDNTRIGPSGAYNHDTFNNPHYNNYFTDMLEWFDQESKTTTRYQTPIVGLPDSECDRVLMRKELNIPNPPSSTFARLKHWLNLRLF